MIWMALWLRVMEWWHRAPEEAPRLPVFSQADLDAIAAMNAPPKEGWYAWECAQYRASGAFWFDPRRYDNTPLAYHKPSTADLVANYQGSSSEAMAKYGQPEVDAATWWVCQKAKDKFQDGMNWEGHRNSLDPIGWCVQMYRAYGSPRVNNVPATWSLCPPQRYAVEATGSSAQWGPGVYRVIGAQQAMASAYQNAACQNSLQSMSSSALQSMNNLLGY